MSAKSAEASTALRPLSGFVHPLVNDLPELVLQTLAERENAGGGAGAEDAVEVLLRQIPRELLFQLPKDRAEARPLAVHRRQLPSQLAAGRRRGLRPVYEAHRRRRRRRLRAPAALAPAGQVEARQALPHRSPMLPRRCPPTLRDNGDLWRSCRRGEDGSCAKHCVSRDLLIAK
eukprot:scaffold114_cov361-Pinguiococcus_pyrenoidosus.AAC.5